MHAKLYCMTNPEDRCAFHNDLCLDVYTIDTLLIVDLLFYVHGKYLRSCRDGQLT